MKNRSGFCRVFLLSFLLSIGLVQWAEVVFAFVIDHQHTDLSAVPDEWIVAAKANLHIAYNHTSHGSQVITGMNALEGFPSYGSKYSWSNTTQGTTDSLSLHDSGIPGEADLSQGDSDSDGDGIDDWAEDTYAYLNSEWQNYKDSSDHEWVNVIMWSWCDIRGHDIPRYIRSMEWLIAQFSEGGSTYTDSVMTSPASPHERIAPPSPYLSRPVQFVFMTGRSSGEGLTGGAHLQNIPIREHCSLWNRILYDFNDIESWDPDGNYYQDKYMNDALYYDSDGNTTRDTYWSSEYLAAHGGEPGTTANDIYYLTKGIDGYGGCGSCAHSEGDNNDSRVNCVLKGRAVWYLYARLAGWSGNVDTHTLTVSETGNGSVTSDPAGISCGATCEFDFEEDTIVSLTPLADEGWNFTSWSGDCTGTEACQVTIDADKAVVALFSRKGDLDGNGELTAADAIVGLKVLAGIDTAVSLAADADGGGSIGVGDIVYLLGQIASP